MEKQHSAADEGVLPCRPQGIKDIGTHAGEELPTIPRGAGGGSKLCPLGTICQCLELVLPAMTVGWLLASSE